MEKCLTIISTKIPTKLFDFMILGMWGHVSILRLSKKAGREERGQDHAHSVLLTAFISPS